MVFSTRRADAFAGPLVRRIARLGSWRPYKTCIGAAHLDPRALADDRAISPLTEPKALTIDGLWSLLPKSVFALAFVLFLRSTALATMSSSKLADLLDQAGSRLKHASGKSDDGGGIPPPFRIGGG